MYGPTPVRSCGIEVVANGNDEADSTVTGLVFTVRPAQRRFTVSLKAGYRSPLSSTIRSAELCQWCGMS